MDNTRKDKKCVGYKGKTKHTSVLNLRYKIWLFFIFLFIMQASLIQKLSAQQQTSISLYNQMAGLYNPSSIPLEYTQHQHNIIVGISGRNQWTKLKSSPKTQSIKLEYISDTRNTFNMLFGTYLLNDRAGPVATTGVYARMASIMSSFDPQVGGFSAGIQLGFTQYRINTSLLHEKYPDDILTVINPQVTKPSISFGISYYNIIQSNGFFKNSKINTGVSIAQLGFSQHEFSDQLSKFNIFTKPHIYAYASIIKPILKTRTIGLNSWIKYVPNAPINIDLHALYHVNKNFWFEIGANSSGIGHIGIGFNFFDFLNKQENLLKLNYAYNPSFIKYGGILGNTHELVLKYSMRSE